MPLDDENKGFLSDCAVGGVQVGAKTAFAVGGVASAEGLGSGVDRDAGSGVGGGVGVSVGVGGAAATDCQFPAICCRLVRRACGLC